MNMTSPFMDPARSVLLVLLTQFCCAAHAQIPASTLKSHASERVRANPTAVAPAFTPSAVAPKSTRSPAASIIVDGRQQHAGDLKKAIKVNLTGTPRGAQRIFRVASRKSNPAHGRAAPVHDAALRAGAARPADLSQWSGTRLHTPAFDARPTVIRPKTCEESGPLIDRTRSPAESGSQFTVDGFCFGDRPGSVELIGQFPGGVLRPAFQQWQDNQLVVAMPSLRGVPDQIASLTVVRADGTRSEAHRLKFIAARERIEVPMHYWNPTGDFDQTVVTEGGGNIFSGFHSTGTGSTVAGNFNVRVSPQCALDNLEVPASAGGVLSVTGFESGPANEAAIVLTYAPICTTRTFEYVVGNESHTVCRIAFQLHTWANCPAGTTP